MPTENDDATSDVLAQQAAATPAAHRKEAAADVVEGDAYVGDRDPATAVAAGSASLTHRSDKGWLKAIGVFSVVFIFGVLAVYTFKGVMGSQGGDVSEGERAAAQTFTSKVNSGHQHQDGPEHAAMLADVKVMAAYQDVYLQTHPGKGPVPVARTSKPVKVGAQMFEPTAPNEVAVLIPGPETGAAPGAYCVVVTSPAMGAPVAWDSTIRDFANFTAMGGDVCGAAFA